MVNHHARRLKKNPTDAERALWRLLKRRQLLGFRFRRQRPIGPYIVDFICLERRLIVEVDGGHHMAQSSDDERRTVWLEGEGHRVLRFWNNDVLRDPATVAQVILDVLSDGQSPPP